MSCERPETAQQHLFAIGYQQVDGNPALGVGSVGLEGADYEDGEFSSAGGAICRTADLRFAAQLVVFGGIGSVWGVVIGALVLQILQSWFLEDLSGWLHALGRLVGVDWLQRVELASSIELIFGLILVLMMLFRRQGLILAARRATV